VRANPLGLQLGVTTITYAGLCYLLLAEQGWRADGRWILVASVGLLIAVSWMEAAWQLRRGQSPVANVLLWGVSVTTMFCCLFTAALL
jgi:hypothetical protein